MVARLVFLMINKFNICLVETYLNVCGIHSEIHSIVYPKPSKVLGDTQ